MLAETDFLGAWQGARLRLDSVRLDLQPQRVDVCVVALLFAKLDINSRDLRKFSVYGIPEKWQSLIVTHFHNFGGSIQLPVYKAG